MTITNCSYCNKEFLIDSYKLKHNKSHCCSRECSNKYKSVNYSGENSPTYKGGISYVDSVCEICGKEYKDRACNHKRFNHHFCSKECRYKWDTIREHKHHGEIVNCTFCNKEFKITKSRKSYYAIFFCSRECKDKDQLVNGRTKLEKNGRWLGGKSYEPYPPTWSHELRNEVRVRDNCTCQICGKPESKEVHHIDYKKDNCFMSNLITLCKTCHNKTNFNREEWQNKLSKLMEERSVA